MRLRRLRVRCTLSGRQLRGTWSETKSKGRKGLFFSSLAGWLFLSLLARNNAALSFLLSSNLPWVPLNPNLNGELSDARLARVACVECGSPAWPHYTACGITADRPGAHCSRISHLLLLSLFSDVQRSATEPRRYENPWLSMWFKLWLDNAVQLERCHPILLRSLQHFIDEL